MLLAIDIGNTNTVLGAFDGEELAQHWRIATRMDYTADEFGVILRGLFTGAHVRLDQLDSVVVSSVVPGLDQAIADMCARLLGLEPLLIGPGVRTGMQIRYDNPREVGADRIVNSVAAYTKYGGPAVVIDFGTATTFDAIGANGDYLGGVIAPGIRISMDALFNRAAKLPRFELAMPPGLEGVIGKNTVESMQAGVRLRLRGPDRGHRPAHAGRAWREVPGHRHRRLASLIAAHAGVIEVVDDNLTLDGLRLCLL